MKTGPDRFLVGPDRSGIFEIFETFRIGRISSEKGLDSSKTDQIVIWYQFNYL